MPLLRRESPIEKEKLEQLYYRQQLSMQEIADEMGCSVHKVQYWMDRHGLVRRPREEANYIKHNPNGDPFKIREPRSEEERELFNISIGLYIGEGTKNRERVGLANTDPEVIRTFLRFLREICGVEEQRISAYLNIFDDVDLEEALVYWQRITGIPRNRFFKPTVRPTKGEDYQNKSKYGTLTVGLSSTKLSSQISNWCNDAMRKLSS